MPRRVYPTLDERIVAFRLTVYPVVTSEFYLGRSPAAMVLPTPVSMPETKKTRCAMTVSPFLRTRRAKR